MNGMNTKDCLRLRGLPFSATVQDVLDFLKEHAAFVVPGGVHMVFNTQVSLIGSTCISMSCFQYVFADVLTLLKVWDNLTQM